MKRKPVNQISPHVHECADRLPCYLQLVTSNEYVFDDDDDDDNLSAIELQKITLMSTAQIVHKALG